MTRYTLLLCAAVFFIGCSPHAQESEPLGVVDSTSTVVTGEGETTQVVYVGGDQFSVRQAADVTESDSLYHVLLDYGNAAPPEYFLCESEAFSDPLHRDLCYKIR
jgi:hypothetical protein